jgi:hypothetical protein
MPICNNEQIAKIDRYVKHIFNLLEILQRNNHEISRVKNPIAGAVKRHREVSNAVKIRFFL